MCLEVYAPNGKIVIPFANESIRFLTPNAIRSRYSVLIRNAGRRPIRELFFLSPYQLLADGEVRGQVELRGPGSIVRDLRASDEFFIGMEGTRLSMRMPDPTDTSRWRPILHGDLFEDNGVFQFPSGTEESHVLLMQRSPFTGWSLPLTHPINPGNAQWFWWQINVANIGSTFATFREPRVIHRIASPFDVRRTFKEYLETAIARFDGEDPEYGQTARELMELFNLNNKRNVDMEYYELRVEPGDPLRQILDYWEVEGALEMRSRSPRVADNSFYEGEAAGQPVYEWRLGSLFRRRRWWQSPPNESFMLRLSLSFQPRAPLLGASGQLAEVTD